MHVQDSIRLGHIIYSNCYPVHAGILDGGMDEGIAVTEGVITDNTGAIIYNLMQQDMSAIRIVFRAGWQVSNPLNYQEATEANRYPAAVLRSPAA